MAFNDDDVREENVDLGPLASADEDGDEGDGPLPTVPEGEEDYE